VVSYALNNSATATQALTANQSASDSFTIQVTDGVATKSVDAVFAITGANDAPVIATSTQQFQQGQAATANLFNIQTVVSDVDGPVSEITNYIFATHQDGDADYSQFTINSSTGQIGLTAVGAEAIAADAIRSDYILHVQAQDKYGAVSAAQAIDIHVNMAVDTVHNSATLPGAMSDWDIEPITKPSETGDTSVSDGFLMINHADPLITIKIPASVPKLTFADGSIWTLSNDASTATGTIKDATTSAFANHSIKVADGTTENTIIDILPNGNYSITGASDSVSDPYLGAQDNFRRDALQVHANLSQAKFTNTNNGLQMVLKDVSNITTGTTVMNEIEVINFNDATLLVAAAGGYSSADVAKQVATDNHLSQTNLYIYTPLNDVYHI
jgi:hypothetical protein